MRNLLTRLLTGWRNLWAGFMAKARGVDGDEGEPVSVIYIYTPYAPDHLAALHFAPAPSQQHRVRLDCSESEATHE